MGWWSQGLGRSNDGVVGSGVVGSRGWDNGRWWGQGGGVGVQGVGSRGSRGLGLGVKGVGW